jgi:hypothetical protein
MKNMLLAGIAFCYAHLGDRASFLPRDDRKANLLRRQAIVPAQNAVDTGNGVFSYG